MHAARLRKLKEQHTAVDVDIGPSRKGTIVAGTEENKVCCVVHMALTL